MASPLEQLFNSANLNVVVPDTSLEYPPETTTDDWLSRLNSGSLERKQAFFDEQLQSFLVVEIPHAAKGPADPEHPPQELVAFLAHLQVSLEASYISSQPPEPGSETPQVNSAFLSAAQPRTASLSKLNPNSSRQHPSIFPPNTPNPTPYSADHDRRYAKSEGTLLNAIIWGQSSGEESREAFSLLYSEKQSSWVVVYRLSLTVSFLRVSVSDPLLCLTISTTLREKPLALHGKNPLSLFMASVGGIHAPTEPPSPTAINGHSDDISNDLHLEGFEEVNLFDALLGGPTFASDDSSSIYLPTSRLGSVSRQKLFSLPPIVPPTPALPTPSPMTAVRIAHHTLRKSYRKTLHTVSGFRVRMRTVFVPSILLPGQKDRLDGEADLFEEEERERREAGNEERTVVLCVEVENSGESGSRVGFVVEDVEVSVTGEGAKTTLIGWGADFHHQKHPKQQLKHLHSTFPMVVGAREQFNLLYAVSFLRSPEEVEGLLGLSAAAAKGPGADKNGMAPPDAELSLQRAVSIVIHGKPCLRSFSQSVTSPIRTSALPASTDEDVSYPTRTFSSRWNCVLDLSTAPSSNQTRRESSQLGPSTPDLGADVLPEPASPFPVSVTSPRANSGSTFRRNSLMSPSTTINSGGSTPAALTGLSTGKRHTLPSAGISGKGGMRSASNPSGFRNSMNSARLPSRTPNLPSVTIQIPKSPTTYDPPNSRPGSPESEWIPPMTPAYPAHHPPGHPGQPPTPMSQGPLASHLHNYIGPSVEIRRERAPAHLVGQFGNGMPQTPGPVVGFHNQQQQQGAEGPGVFERMQSGPGFGMLPTEDHSIVVSIGLLPLRTQDAGVSFSGKIYPLSYFTLDVFVFNRSERTRRFEVSCPDVRRRRRKMKKDPRIVQKEVGALADDSPGVLPLDNRVRIGPLLPSACQSVRMEFLAVTPGVHSIDTLTLVDVESGFSMNLRSVMDIVVHEITD
ncbi:TRAPP trafficking subunit Trs65-domain-containing protein [Mycena floridula]|nr:TRAPP trafficking subunit Trs65-domain-containing protein [Mycena floridula]